MIQLALLNWLPVESGKIRIFEIFQHKKDFCDTIKSRQIFSRLSRTEMFPLLPRHNRAKFGADPKTYAVWKSRFTKYCQNFWRTMMKYIVKPIAISILNV